MNIESVTDRQAPVGALTEHSVKQVEERWSEEERKKTLKQVLHYLVSLGVDAPHARHVTKLALGIFDDLSKLHSLGSLDRFRLRCAALLHDIGWVQGAQGHHKRSLRMILDASELALTERSRPIIANIARYHRRSLPKQKHRSFALLSNADQHKVSLLGAIVRLADALDCSHLQLVRDVHCRIGDTRIDVDVVCVKPAPLELFAAQEKGEWLKALLHREIFVNLK